MDSIKGLTDFGSTEQTRALAQALRKDAAVRAKMRAWLDETDKWITYSNQDFDQQQAMAAFLADTIRAAR